MKTLFTWLLIALWCLGSSYQLCAATAVPEPEPMRIVYIGGINGYLNLCG